MRITTWNVNGLRKLSPLARTFDTLSSDIICIQETRVSSIDDPDFESLACVPGYYSFFSICRTRAGYSGVATFCRKSIATPVAATNSLADSAGGVDIPSEGGCDIGSRCDCLGAGYNNLTLKAVYDEGRFVLTDHKHFVLINVYIPATSIQTRAAFKLSFLHALNAKIAALNESGRRVILVGDLNICPARIDSAERIRLPPDPEWDCSPGRMWLSRLITPPTGSLVDSFRLSFPDRRDAFTCWSEAMRARITNYGVRIDLILIHRGLTENTTPHTDIWNHVTGSDHCPVSLKLVDPCLFSPVASCPPTFCTQLLPRFTKRQQPITRYFLKPPQARQMTTNPTGGAIETAHNQADIQNKLDQSQEPVDLQTVANTNQLRSDPPSSIKTIPINPVPQLKKTIIKTLRKRTRCNDSTESKKDVQTTLRLTKQSENTVVPTLSRPSRSSKLVTKKPTNNTEINNCRSELRPLPPQMQVGRVDLETRKQVSAEWRKLLCGPKKPPVCRHGETCVLKKVNKSSDNKGRTFFACKYPHGIGPHTNCNFFQWAPFNARFPTVPLPP